MGQEVKNLLRAQSKYGLMGSSAKTGKKIFHRSQEQFLDKTVIWDRTPSQLYINCSVYLWGRAQGSQIFKQNSIISIHSKVMAFLVILLSPWSPCGPHCPCIMSLSSPLSSPHCPRHPHIIPMAPRRFPCGPHCPRCPHCPHPCCPHRPHVIPVIPTLSPLFPHHLEGPHIIPNLPVSHPTQPLPPGG